MGRIFIAAGQTEIENGGGSGRASAEIGTTARQIILLRDLIIQILRSRSYDTLSVPEDLNSMQAIEWINRRAQPGDIAIEIQAASPTANATRQMAATLYIADNDQRRIQAEQLLQAYLRRVPQIANQGAKPDTYTDLGYLHFCRDLRIPALVMQVGHLTNLEDQWVIPAQPQDVALGIAEGLAGWSRAMSDAQAETSKANRLNAYAPISIVLNGALYEDEGLLIQGNAYVPVDLTDQLNLKLGPQIRSVAYGNLVYIRAVDLKDCPLSVHWDKETNTLSLRSALMIPASQIHQIMGRGNTSEVQLMMFLKGHNPESLARFPDLPKLYREEAMIEGVSYDIAFAQMCVETQFLRFNSSIKPDQNNFAGLGGLPAEPEGARFLDPRIGVRAHIQHLKAYASTEPLVQKTVDPRFHLVRRGVAPTVDRLSHRWSTDPEYATKIMAIVRRLYESAGLL